jgi:hypothetical protein
MKVIAEGNSRIIEGDTPYLRYRVVDGEVELWQMREAAPAPAVRPGRRAVMPPGDWLAMLIQVVSFGLVRPCAKCKNRMAAMNRAGWRGLPKLALHWIGST